MTGVFGWILAELLPLLLVVSLVSYPTVFLRGLMEKTVAEAKEAEVVVDDNGREVQDPLVKFFKKSGKEFFWTVVAVLAIVYGYQRFQETRVQSQRDAADIYFRVQREVGALDTAASNVNAQRAKLAVSKESEKKAVEEDLAKAETELKTATQRAQGTIDSLSDARSPYSEIAKYYRGVLAYKAGDRRGVINSVGNEGWRTLPAGIERMTGELGAYLAAKVKLDMADQRATGMADLVALTKDGMYAAVAAAASLNMVAESSEERELARREIEALGKRNPEQLDLLQFEK